MGTFQPAVAAIAVFLSGALLPGIAAGKSSRHPQSHAAAHSHGGAQRTPPPITADAVNNAQFSPSLKFDKASPLIVKAEILLDRQSISPGQIDGHAGDNARKAIAAFQDLHGLDATGKLDEATWNELTRNVSDPAIVEYQISDNDVKGPFAKTIPRDLVKMARLEHLSYTSPLELLSEKFHVDPKLLQELNPGKRFEEAGTTIFVPNVGERDTSARVVKVEVEKWNRAVRALGEHGEVIAFYPASIGSEDKPAPSGQFKVRRVAYHPKYHYDPKFHFKGVHTNRKLTVAAGPNNPVGVVWIDLTIDSYGIHGTPDPERIGKSYSHGCIRLTNWDALDLARRVRRGTPVAFLDKPSAPLPTNEGPGEARGRQ
jgi:lipoprotein-anchoring transpeptidase ErfK/SrfK